MQAEIFCETRPTAEAHQKSMPHLIVTIFGAAIVAAAIAQFVLFAVFLDRTMILRPFTDMIYWIDSYLNARQHGDLLSYLWLPHNEHHFVIVRLLTALDTAAFRASGVPFVVTATVATIVSALIIYVEFRRDKQLTGPLRVLACLSPMLLLTTAAAVDCSIPTNCVYPLSVVFLVATLALFCRGREFAPDVGTQRTAALVTAILASFSNAVGLAIWPALLYLAWRVGASKKWLVGIGALGICYGLFYVWTLPSFGPGGPSRIDLDHLVKMANYLFAYLGLPLSRSSELDLVSRGLGAGLLVAAVIAILFDVILRRPATRLHLIGICLIIIGLGVAFLAAIGRVDIEQEVKLPVRYSILVALLHIGLLALALPFLARFATTSQRQIAVLGGGTALAGTLLVLQIISGRYAIIDSRLLTNAIVHFEQTGQNESGMERLFPNPVLANRVLTEIRNSGN
jgi:hypothetical protein